MSKMSIVEETLRAQKEVLAEITQRVASLRDKLPKQPPKRVLLFGLGSSHYVARLVAHTLLRGKSRPEFQLVPCTALGIGTEVFPQAGDWAIGFSHRGKNKPTLASLQMCKEAGAFTMFVAAKGAADPSKVDLLVEAGPLERAEPHSHAITGAVCAATTLFMGDEAKAEWLSFCAQKDPDLVQCRETVGDGPTVILGEHVAEWVAKEGALKFIEMARHPVRAYGTEEFFHGTSWGIKPEDRVWHVALPNDGRAKDIPGEARVTRTLAIQGASPLAWMPAMIELQWLGLALALNKGEDPDDPVAAIAREKAARAARS